MINLDAARLFLPVLAPESLARVVFSPGLKYETRNASRKAGSAVIAIERTERSVSRPLNHPFGYVYKSAFLR
jgi:hypothetical protein